MLLNRSRSLPFRLSLRDGVNELMLRIIESILYFILFGVKLSVLLDQRVVNSHGVFILVLHLLLWFIVLILLNHGWPFNVVWVGYCLSSLQQGNSLLLFLLKMLLSLIVDVIFFSDFNWFFRDRNKFTWWVLSSCNDRCILNYRRRNIVVALVMLFNFYLFNIISDWNTDLEQRNLLFFFNLYERDLI